MLMTGDVETDICTVSAPVSQPFDPVITNEYVVVAFGDAVGCAAVLLDNPVDGVHAYV